MKSPLLTLLLLATLSLASASAINPVHSFLSSEKSESCIVGQKIDIIIEVFSETHFSGSTRFTLPDIAGTVFYKPEERAVVGSKEVEGVTYSVQRHEFAFYPQRAGRFTIPPFDVRYGIAGKPGEKPTEHTTQTQAIEITAAMPPGAEKLHSLISTTDLKVTESWAPTLKASYTAGNAIKRHLTFRAPDMPGMVFPSIRIPETEGLKIYRARATINDKINRGSLIGERSDTITYICQEPGHYELPAVNIHWWNLDQQTLKVITLPAVTFEVTPSLNANKTPDAKQNEPVLSKKIIFSTLIVLLGVLFTLYKFRRPLQQRYTDWQKQRQESESATFKKITPNLSPADTLNAINQWLTHTSGPHLNLTDWTTKHNTPDLNHHVEALQRAVVSQDPHWNAAPLIVALKKARSNDLRSDKAKASHLPALNPRKNHHLI